jgi:head-tail adaptor
VKLDRRVQFRRLALVSDGFGSAESWANHGAAQPAAKKDISDGERWRAGEVQSHVTARFVVRSSEFTRGLTPADRLDCQGLSYDIAGIKELDRRGFLEITAAARNDSHV